MLRLRYVLKVTMIGIFKHFECTLSKQIVYVNWRKRHTLYLTDTFTLYFFRVPFLVFFVGAFGPRAEERIGFGPATLNPRRLGRTF